MRLLLLLCIALASLAVSADDEYPIPRSGFLPQAAYDRLELFPIREDEVTRRWFAPQVSRSSYSRAIIDPVVFYPEPAIGDQVSLAALESIAAYTTGVFSERMDDVLPLVGQPGPEVLRARGALTGVSVVTEGMKPYEVLPVAAVLGGIKALSGRRDQDVWVFFEVRFEDSLTGELVGASYHSVKGEQLKGKRDSLTLEDIRSSLDLVCDEGREMFSQHLSVK